MKPRLLWLAKETKYACAGSSGTGVIIYRGNSMARYKFADLVVDLKNEYDFLAKQCAEYRYVGDASAELSVCVTDEQIRWERNFSQPGHSDGYLESICAYRNLCLELPAFDGLLLHGSVIDCDGRGIAFLARSGVGKTTHTMLWKQVYEDRVKIINGDKPIVRFFDGIPYAYGTPWAGKENFHCNARVRLTDICFIERSPENRVVQISPEECLDAVMQQILLPQDPQMTIKTLQLLDRMLSDCRIWRIGCNISREAACLAHDTIIGDEYHEA